MDKMDDIAVIGGSQAYALLGEGGFEAKKIDTVRTPFGDVDSLYTVRFMRHTIYLLSRHGNKGYDLTASFVNYRANIYALRELGVRRIIAWTGPGAINDKYEVGTFAVVDDILDETRSRQSTFFTNKGHGFIRMSDPFCPTLASAIGAALGKTVGTYADEATYVCTEGPRLETPAEIKKYRRFGGDLVGMTLAPECFLARELEICYAAIAYITNSAEGGAKKSHKPGKLFGGLASDEELDSVKNAVLRFPEIIEKTIECLGMTDSICNCQEAMLRFKKSRRIGEDWHEWIGA